ncbi:MAG: hypothetical protein IKN25_08315, partial [Spirochaetales bacterium]|nr:hypothetical protein [Spirochaetales bacterium]
MSKGLFDKASLYREEFLDRPNEGLLAQALDYLNSKDKAETAAEMKIGGEPVLPPLPDASEFHPINEPTVADIMPDEETVRQRLAEIEAQVCAAEDSQSSSEVIPNADEADTDKDGETFFLEGDSVQEQQPDYEEEVLIIDLPRDDDPFAALLAQMGGDGESETMDNAQSTLHNEEDNPTDDESGNDDTSSDGNEGSVISVEAEESVDGVSDDGTSSDGNEGSVISTEAEKSDDEILNQVQDDDSSADDNSSEANEAGNDDAETAPTAEFVEAVDSSFDENIIEEVTQGTSFVGDAIVYDADAVTEKTFTDNNVSFTQLPPTDEPAPDVDEDLPTGILTADQSEDNETDNADNLTDDEISVPADDEDSDMAELPAVE